MWKRALGLIISPAAVAAQIVFPVLVSAPQGRIAKALVTHAGGSAHSTSAVTTAEANTTGATLITVGVVGYTVTGLASALVTDSLTSTGGLRQVVNATGGSIAGDVGQTCILSGFNGGGSDATVTATLMVANSLSSAVYTITAAGSGYTSPASSAILGNGTATCSGTPTVFAIFSSFGYCTQESLNGTGDTFSFVCGTVNPTTSASYTVTANTGATSYPNANFFAFNGTVTGPGYDMSSGFKQNAATTIQPGSITPSQNGEACASVLGYQAINTPTINASFTTEDNNPFTSGTSVGSAAAYLIQSTAAAVNPTWTVTTGTDMATSIACWN